MFKNVLIELLQYYLILFGTPSKPAITVPGTDMSLPASKYGIHLEPYFTTQIC